MQSDALLVQPRAAHLLMFFVAAGVGSQAILDAATTARASVRWFADGEAK